ncbi:MAG: alcohol dehydrogenase catalytic domain-containing protein [Lachnospiraceae bacterium]|nr:alcohol dehydrogenase catalytic domain-containing protein [Lachnospiraceae bacterium]MBD5456509.1 alcohol dehydrogenase catalytic domain-containing protein [Lachnospiraceae bacterium]
MKGIYYNGEDAVYREDLPMPVRDEKESLIKIHICAVCNTDKEVRKGYRPDFRGIMGHEFVGEVVESPNPSLIGKRVVGELNAACGKCIYCRTGRPTHCLERKVLGMAGKDGAFAEYMTIDTDLLHVVPDDLPDEIAVFTEPLAAALEILTQIKVSPDKNAAVLGDGRLALLVAQVLALTGIDLTVIGRHEDKLERFRSFAKVTDCGEKEGYEYVAECTGSESGLPMALTLVRKKGTIILKSTYAGNLSIDMSMVAVNEITIVGSRCGPFEPALKLLKEGRIKLPPIELYELKDFEKAFASDAFKAGFFFG